MDAYTLQLPTHLTMHPTFHASVLRPYHRHVDFPDQPVLAPITDHDPSHKNEPISSILDKRVYKGTVQYLVHWKASDKSSWIPANKLETAHHLILEWEDMLASPRNK
jgi:hypothetical protein